MSLPVEETDLTELTEGVFDAFLGMGAEPIESATPLQGRLCTATVHISGGWEGSVVVAMPEDLARNSAAAMYGTAVDQVGPDELTDAVGEIANILGGNVKGLIETACSLSLPTVTSGSDYALRIPGSERVRDVAMAALGHTFHVSVYRRSAR